MIIYLDACCWSRPSDKKTDKRIRQEAGSIHDVLAAASKHGYTVLGSAFLVRELAKTKPRRKLSRIAKLYVASVTKLAAPYKNLYRTLGAQAQKAGIEGADAHHLCIAEASGADYLITVDDDFVDAAKNLNTNVKVILPKNFPLGGAV